MKYPSYVPAPVQQHVTAMIEGNRLEPHGLSTSLSNAEQELRKIAQAIETRIQQGAIEFLPRIRLEEADAKRHRLCAVAIPVLRLHIDRSFAIDPDSVFALASSGTQQKSVSRLYLIYLGVS